MRHDFSSGFSFVLSVQGDTHQTGIGPIVILAAFGVYTQHAGNVRHYLAGAVSKNAGSRMLTVYRYCPAFTDNSHVIPQSRPCSANDNICVPPMMRGSGTRISSGLISHSTRSNRGSCSRYNSAY